LKITKLLAALLFCTVLTASAQKIDASVSYELQHSNGPAGACGCFDLQGVRADVSYRLFRGLDIAGEISGAHASNITGSGLDLTLLTYMAGPRYSVRMRNRLKPFVQFLIGGTYGFDSTFPNSAGGSASSKSFALSTGGGLDYKLSQHIAVRVVQIDYLGTYLPNNASNKQNNLRVGAGIVFRVK
jgi:outer membrane immunogenic protein